MRQMWTMGMAVGLLALSGVAGGAQEPDDVARERMRLAEVMQSRVEVVARTDVRRLQALSQLRERRLVRQARDLSNVTRRMAEVSAVRSDRALAQLRREGLEVAARVRELARRTEGAALREVGSGRGIAAATAPEAWLPQDPADSLYREARSHLNARRFAVAARSFARIREEYPRSGYVGDAFYFEALARSRVGAQAELRSALELLEVQRARHPEAATVSDARSLAVRIESQLARRGDAQAAEALVGAARGVGSAQTACDDQDQALRATALSALLQMDPDRARPILQEVLRSRDECSAGLRAQAVFILAQNLDDEADDATIELLLDLAHRNPDPDPEVREAAVFWLSESGREEAVDALVSILESGTATPEIAERAIFALGQSGNPRALQILRDYAADTGSDLELRANAIFWLGQQGGDDAGPFLRSLYGSLDDPELKERVFFSIAETSSQDGLEWLTARALDPSEDVRVRMTALFWAGEAGLTPEQALRIYRTADDRELREQAIYVLTQVAEEGEAVDALMEIARSEEDPELREQAVFWLGQTDDPRVAEFLLEIIRRGGGGGGE